MSQKFEPREMNRSPKNYFFEMTEVIYSLPETLAQVIQWQNLLRFFFIHLFKLNSNVNRDFSIKL